LFRSIAISLGNCNLTLRASTDVESAKRNWIRRRVYHRVQDIERSKKHRSAPMVVRSHRKWTGFSFSQEVGQLSYLKSFVMQHDQN
jgi:hypothetical protein